MVEEISLVLQELQARSYRPKTLDSKAVLQAHEADLISNRSVSGELSISHSTFTATAYAYGDAELYLMLLKYCKTFDSPK